MITVKTILAGKGPHVWSIGRGASVLEAAQMMTEHKIGALVVLEGGELVGMFTERDVLHRVVSQRRDPAATPVGEVMTADVYCCTPETTLDEARGVMKNRRFRHLPVVDGDRRLLGLVSIGDLNAHLAASQELTIHHLKEYVAGRT